MIKLNINFALGIVCLVLAGIFLLFVTYLLIFHTVLSFTNITTCKFKILIQVFRGVSFLEENKLSEDLAKEAGQSIQYRMEKQSQTLLLLQPSLRQSIRMAHA